MRRDYERHGGIQVGTRGPDGRLSNLRKDRRRLFGADPYRTRMGARAYRHRKVSPSKAVRRRRMEFGPAPRTLPSAPTTRCAGTNRSIGVCRIRRASIAGSHAPEIRGRDAVAVSRHHQAGAQRRGDRQTCYLHRGYKRRMNEQTPAYRPKNVPRSATWPKRHGKATKRWTPMTRKSPIRFPGAILRPRLSGGLGLPVTNSHGRAAERWQSGLMQRS